LKHWDDRSRKQRARDLAALKRKGPTREPYDAVLIVCEGAKTEPQYFGEMRAKLRLASTNVVITGEGATDPIGIVNTAIALFAADPIYDRVYCVFDRDTHATYRPALEKIAATRLRREGGKRGAGVARFAAITSVPCFEYWLLLHYEYTTRPYERVGRHSACDRLIHELKSHGHLPDYGKGAKGLYKETAPRLETAMNHARRALAAAESGGTDNPTTRVHELVEYLVALAARRP